MTPSARVQAAIELLDEVVAAARGGGAAADTLIARYFKTRRYAGSGDRRAIRDHVYAAIRRAGDPPVSGRAAMVGVAAGSPELSALFDGSPHGPMPIDPAEPAAVRSVAPAWLMNRLSASLDGPEIEAMLDRAPLDLRVNRLKGDRADVLAAFPQAAATPHSPVGVRLADPIQVEAHPLWNAGVIEIQDEGSQLIALACAARPGETVVDLCAGAGGKTLALAAEMGGEGRIVACDTDRARLSRLAPRAARAGADAVETRLLDPGKELDPLGDVRDAADLVLVDAPCSGSGTWRRNPEARWRLTPDRLARLQATQARLLDIAAALVRPGGRMVYAVCSLIDDEGADQIAAFLSRNPGWTAGLPLAGAGRARGQGLMLSPAHDGTDGFFIAGLHRPC
ncbi:MAG: RNA methyltransferase [Sphingomonas sp. SCN 67-18]|uniref:RsmB/NOP family class I SAM-dependent RNA methyltransferase n=1 Tax=uncultured Sphingomonas sp. TaxID=158754 RepID=UPI000868DC27|nr:RsmB/NOP family class I SAM-dependent RNA methyltransferase [Sphingomonas sp. SCN 67-18]ODU19521.1 MAG: RNA methyltransferase [Sphingomonas sp. SCN 67-18]